jgi:hypothetical protein
MAGAHLNGQLRTCGATTIVVGQTSVFVNGLLWAVDGDVNSHGNGNLIASGTFVTIAGKRVVINKPDLAMPDNLCPVPGGTHCSPMTAQGSVSVFCYGP